MPATVPSSRRSGMTFTLAAAGVRASGAGIATTRGRPSRRASARADANAACTLSRATSLNFLPRGLPGAAHERRGAASIDGHDNVVAVEHEERRREGFDEHVDVVALAIA